MNTDLAVQSLLNDQENKQDSQVVQAVRDVLSSIRRHELNYGGQVRAITKALMIINEEHRQHFAG